MRFEVTAAVTMSLINCTAQHRKLTHSVHSNKTISSLSIRQMGLANGIPPTADVTAVLTEDGRKMHYHSEVCPDV